ncbi:SMI1/KNR4 family protein [Clostridium sp. JS66]|uniref:SMI1/KNR4 family protein n=1 Tax=Clostridium sp. JS66 TaxID=3064705 RepID=UPI00298E66E6|nr:SMI1/KNR4 family protein [Clostridium sp. JS66]WPC43877.1 SMI1/KNR4 family protein [Clostridium sp. JS66]
MERKNEIVRIIGGKKHYSNYTGGVDNSRVLQIETILKVDLPESYKWFLQNYGHILIMGIEIYGVSKGEIPSCIKATERYRKFGLPLQFVVIESSDEWIYCLDTSDIKDGECTIVDWDRREGVGSQEYKNFYEFFYERLKDACENWD